MPEPGTNTLHIDKPLRDLTIAAIQSDEDFILGRIAPILPVSDKSAKYFVYPTGDWNRLEMKPRGNSEESAGSGWGLSKDDYHCNRDAVHKDFDIAEQAIAEDAIDLDSDAADWCANQARLRGDQLLNAVAMKEATWTTDWDGKGTKSWANKEILQWSHANSTPQKDHLHLDRLVKAACGKRVTHILMGADVAEDILTHSKVIDAIKYTDPTMVSVIRAKLAAFFGVTEVLFGEAFYNSAKQGQAAVLTELVRPKDILGVYVNPRVGKRSMSALKTFAWKHEGLANKGIVTRKMDIPLKTSIRSEIETFWDVKVVSSGAGYYIKDAVA